MVPRLMDKLALRTAIRLAVVPPVAASRADAATRRAMATGVSVFKALLVGTLVGLVPIPLLDLPKIANVRHSLDAAKPVHWSSDVQFFS